MKKIYQFSLNISVILFLLILLSSQVHGQGFTSLANGVNGTVRTAVSYNGGIVIGGDFTNASGLTANRVAFWNGSYWSAMGTGMNDDVNDLLVVNGDLYAAGNFTTAGGVSAHRIAKWNGTSWSSLGLGLNDEAEAMAVYNNLLYVGGDFTSASGVSANHIAVWNGSSWSGVGLGTSNTVYALQVFNNELYVGGSFSSVGGTSVGRIARWNGSNWNSVGSGVTSGSVIYVLKVINYSLYAGGNFNSIGGVASEDIARWNGASWSGLANGVNGSGVRALGLFMGEIYLGGGFTSAVGGISMNRIAKWNGTNFSTVSSGTNNTVMSILPFNGTVIAGGDFTSAGGTSVNRITMWGTVPGAPNLISPADGSQNVPVTPLLTWSVVANSSSYRVQVSNNANFTTLMVNQSLSANQYQVPNGALSPNVTYFWRANATNAMGTGAYSSIFFFNSTITGIGDPNTTPDKWSLYNNYPNPFNPSTKIKFDVPANGRNQKVNLVVFNSAGEEIQTLLNSEFAPGKYEVVFNAKNLSSGVYFYRLSTDNFVDTKKMMLVK